jgi:hypothetical protein
MSRGGVAVGPKFSGKGWTMRRVSLLVCVLVAAVASRQDVWAQFDGGERPKPSPWKISPPRHGEVPEEDRLARERLIKLIEEKQTDDFRRRFRVVVPDKPTGLPDDYECPDVR